METLVRYARLYGYFVRFSVSRALEFRFDFFFRIGMDLVYYAVNLAFFKILFLHTSEVAGWTEPQVMIFISGALVVDAIQMTIFSNNMWMFPLLVNRGDLDYYLVRPVSTLFFVSLRDFAVNSFVNLVAALGILGWAVARYPGPVHAGQLAFLVALLFGGAVLHFLVKLIFLLPVFWSHSGRGFEQVFWGMTKMMERPDRIFTGWVRRTLVTILPFSIMASFPARLFIEGFDSSIFIHFSLILVLFGIAAIAFWRHALGAYSSASS